MAKKRKSSSNSRLTTKAPTTAPMLIKAPLPAAAASATAVPSTPAVSGSTSPAVARTENVIAIAETEILVDRNAIAQRAFARFLARGGTHGHALEDWLAAEVELRTRAAL